MIIIFFTMNTERVTWQSRFAVGLFFHFPCFWLVKVHLSQKEKLQSHLKSFKNNKSVKGKKIQKRRNFHFKNHTFSSSNRGIVCPPSPLSKKCLQPKQFSELREAFLLAGPTERNQKTFLKKLWISSCDCKWILDTKSSGDQPVSYVTGYLIRMLNIVRRAWKMSCTFLMGKFLISVVF